MGHGGKEVGFGVVGHPGRLIGVLQRPALAVLLRPLPGHIDTGAVEGGDAVPAVLCADIGVGHSQYLYGSVPGENTSFHHGFFAGFPGVGHNFGRPLNIVRMHVGTLAVKLLLKFLFGITDQIQEIAAVPENRPHILGIHPREPAGNGPDNGLHLLVLFSQLILRTLTIVGQLDARPAPGPADLPVFDHKGFLQKRIVKFPVIIRILPQPVVGAEGTGSGSSLNDFITFAPQHLSRGFSQRFAGILI